MKKICLIVTILILIVLLGTGNLIFRVENKTTNKVAEKSENEIKIEENIIIEENNETSNVPERWNDNGIFSDYYEKAYEKLNELTLEEKVGQLFLARVPSTNQIEDIKKYNLGGYILFGVDTKNETKNTLKNKVQSYQDASKIPMIIATDEEGGTVVRVSSNTNLRKERFLSPQQLYNKGGLELIEQTTIEMSQLLESVGINTDLAPVADISTDPNDYIYGRALGQDAKTTAEFIKTVISTSKQGNVSYVLKHFPGYGNNKDTHTGISIDNRTLESFKNNDFIPFEAGIKEGAEAILVSHNIITKVDKNNPASLSKEIHNIIREDLEFTGIIMTDDLAMDAIKKYTSESPAVAAIKAGNDMLIITDYKTGYTDIMQAIENGEIEEEQIDEKVFKILAWKFYKGLLK